MARFRLNFAKISSGKCPIPYDTFKIFRALSVSGEQFIVIFLKTLQKMIRFKWNFVKILSGTFHALWYVWIILDSSRTPISYQLVGAVRELSFNILNCFRKNLSDYFSFSIVFSIKRYFLKRSVGAWETTNQFYTFIKYVHVV